MNKEELIKAIDEIADLIIECSDANEDIWRSDCSYSVCTEKIIHNDAITLGQIAGKLSAIKIKILSRG